MTLTAAALWACFGLLLLIAEIFSGSFVLCFFGLAALLVAGIKKVTGLDQLALEMVAFALFGMSGLFAFRKKLLRNFGHSTASIALDNQSIITINTKIPANSTAKIEYQGSLWDAYNESSQDLRQGDRARVIATQGIKLIIRPIGVEK